MIKDKLKTWVTAIKVMAVKKVLGSKPIVINKETLKSNLS